MCSDLQPLPGACCAPLRRRARSGRLAAPQARTPETARRYAPRNQTPSRSLRFTPAPRGQARKASQSEGQGQGSFAPAGATKGVPPWILPLAAWQKGQTLFAPSGLSVKVDKEAGCEPSRVRSAFSLLNAPSLRKLRSVRLPRKALDLSHITLFKQKSSLIRELVTSFFCSYFLNVRT